MKFSRIAALSRDARAARARGWPQFHFAVGRTERVTVREARYRRRKGAAAEDAFSLKARAGSWAEFAKPVPPSASKYGRQPRRPLRSTGILTGQPMLF